MLSLHNWIKSIKDSFFSDFDLMSRRILVASSHGLVKDWLAQVDFKTDEFKRDYPDVIHPCT